MRSWFFCRASPATYAVTLTVLACAQQEPVPGEGPVEVAVAANMAAAQRELATDFTRRTGIPVRSSVAATGQLYAQIVRGAPFHLLLSADESYVRLLEADGLIAPGSRSAYAVGRLAVFAPSLGPLPEPPWAVLSREGVRIALANPRTAPYGAAAAAALEAEGLDASLQDAFVWGESVGQAFQFVKSGAAEIGMVALSQVIGEAVGSYWIVPAELHPELRQEAALLLASGEHEGARAFLAYLGSTAALHILERYGYEVPALDDA